MVLVPGAAKRKDAQGKGINEEEFYLNKSTSQLHLLKVCLQVNLLTWKEQKATNSQN